MNQKHPHRRHAKKQAVTLASLIVIMAAIVSACGTSPKPDDKSAVPAETAKAAAESKELVMYSGRKEKLLVPIMDAFEKKTGIKVKAQFGASNEFANKIKEEAAHPAADVYISLDAGIIDSMGNNGLLEQMSDETLKPVDPAWHSSKNYWTGLSSRYRVILYNKDLVKESELPTSVLELSDPKYKDQLFITPGSNQSLQAQVSAIRLVKGEDAAKSFLDGLVKNNVSVLSNHDDIRKAVGAGERKFGLINNYYYYQQLDEKDNNHVGIVYPDQQEGQMGIVNDVAAIGIVKGAQHKDAAEKFVQFLLSNEGQAMFAGLNSEVPIVQGVPFKERGKPMSELKFANVKLEQLAAELDKTRKLIDSVGGLPIK